LPVMVRKVRERRSVKFSNISFLRQSLSNGAVHEKCRTVSSHWLTESGGDYTLK
jgi:hypothetical protein